MSTIEKLAAHVQNLEEELRSAKATLKAHHTNLNNQANGLSPSEKAKLAMELPPLPGHLYKILMDPAVSFTTGSTAFGDRANAQDLDIVTQEVPYEFNGYVIGDLDSAYKTDKEVLYANYGGKLVNIICIGDTILFNQWKAATRIMQNLDTTLHALVRGDKWKRVRLFRALLDVFDNNASRGGVIDLASALEQQRCLRCGKEAINFLNADNRNRFLAHGICDRQYCVSVEPKART